MRLFLLFCIFSIMLTACGFHLRGKICLPKSLDYVYISSSEQNRSLVNTLRTLLTNNHVRVCNCPEQAKNWLVIKYAGHQQQISSVGIGTNPRQYQLIYKVDFLLQTPKGKIIKPLTQVSVARQLTVNNNRILGSDEEAGLLLSEMRREAAVRILTRLSH